MGVVPVNAPRLERALHDVVVSGTADVIHHFFGTAFLKGFANARAKSFEYLVPRSARPLPAAARPHPLHGIEHSVRVMNLINRCWTLGAQTAAARRMLRIAFELRDLPGFFVNVSQHAASRFAVKANRRNQLVVFLNAPRPGVRIVLDPVVPFFHRRTESKVAAVAFEIRHRKSPKTPAG